MKCNISFKNEWPTWRSFGISLFDLDAHLYPWLEEKFKREDDKKGVAVPVGTLTHATVLNIHFTVLGMGIYLFASKEWNK